MNWSEAFQAMSEGKTVAKTVAGKRDILYRVHDGEFQYKLQNCNFDWSRSFQEINDWIKFRYELVIEYTLTFLEAMNEIQKGHKVECEKVPGTVMSLNEDGDVIIPTVFGPQIAHFDSHVVKAKWRVVEEEE